MCKFSNRLFLCAILCAVINEMFVDSATIRSKHKSKSEDLHNLLDLLTLDTNYKTHYDQRQKGEENLRIKLDGFFIGLPGSDTSEVMLVGDDILEYLGEELLLGLGKSRSTTTNIPDAFNYNRSDANNQKTHEETERTEKIVVEIPAPKKLKKPIVQVQTKSTEELNIPNNKSKSKLSQLLVALLRARSFAASNKK